MGVGAPCCRPGQPWGGVTLGDGWQPSHPGQIDMLQAEVTALKTLVITSTPASPNRELHPQLLSPTKAGPRKGHLRHKSTSSALCPLACPAAGHILTPDKEGREVRAEGGPWHGPTVSQAVGPGGTRPDLSPITPTPRACPALSGRVSLAMRAGRLL